MDKKTTCKHLISPSDSVLEPITVSSPRWQGTRRGGIPGAAGIFRPGERTVAQAAGSSGQGRIVAPSQNAPHVHHCPGTRCGGLWLSRRAAARRHRCLPNRHRVQARTKPERRRQAVRQPVRLLPRSGRQRRRHSGQSMEPGPANFHDMTRMRQRVVGGRGRGLLRHICRVVEILRNAGSPRRPRILGALTAPH